MLIFKSKSIILQVLQCSGEMYIDVFIPFLCSIYLPFLAVFEIPLGPILRFAIHFDIAKEINTPPNPNIAANAETILSIIITAKLVARNNCYTFNFNLSYFALLIGP